MADDTSGADLAREALEQAKARSKRVARTVKPKQKKRSKGDPQTFGAAIDAFLKVRGWEHDVRMRSVFARWAEIAGPEIADHCEPTALRDGELLLQAESTSWATQLRLMTRQIADKINADLGAPVVTSVKVHGPASARPRNPGEWRVRGGRGERDTYG